ncbi:MAG: TetR/AcrR family transcriptional regulator [Desulfuromonadales bacterium]|nr:TetR/AcrR family transcriptional regulator [Desulfuromonadales bacterium]
MEPRKKEKRTALLQAALKLFTEHGFHGASTAQIAKHAGVASGTLFFHFNSKEELIHTLFREVQAKILSRINESLTDEKPVRERFLATFTELLHYFLENPDEFKFLEQYHFSPFDKHSNYSRSEDNPLRKLLSHARQQQLIKDAPMLFLEAIAFGPLVALAKEHANHGTPVDAETVRLTIEACWDGLKIS